MTDEPEWPLIELTEDELADPEKVQAKREREARRRAAESN